MRRSASSGGSSVNSKTWRFRHSSYAAYANPASLEEEGSFVHVYGGFETFLRIRAHLDDAKDIEGEAHVSSWKVKACPPPKFKIVQRGSLSRALMAARRAVAPDQKIYVTHVSLHDRCATVAIAEALGRCLVVAVSATPLAHGNRGMAVPNYVQHAILIKDDWLGEAVSSVFKPNCDALLTRFRTYYRTPRRPANDEVRVPSMVMDARIEEAVVNGYRLDPDDTTREAIDSQRHALIHCFKKFLCGVVTVAMAGDMITIRVDPVEPRRLGSFAGGAVTTADARVRRVVKSYDEEVFEQGEHIARWLTLFVANCAPKSDDAYVPATDPLWESVMTSIGHAPSALLFLVACDVLPNLVADPPARTVLPVRLILDDADQIQDLIATDEDTLEACGLDPDAHLRRIALNDDANTIRPCCVTPGTSAYGVMRGVNIMRLDSDRPDNFLNVA